MIFTQHLKWSFQLRKYDTYNKLYVMHFFRHNTSSKINVSISRTAGTRLGLVYKNTYLTVK